MKTLALCVLLIALPALAETQRFSVPALPLVDQHGAPVSLPDLQGTVVLSFMFTTCETLCPVTNSILAALDDRLEAEGATDVAILSITLDPANDRPEVLLESAQAFGASARWRFVTGDGATDTARAFGMSVYDIALHDPVIFIGTPADGMFLRRFGNPSPDELIAAIKEVAAGR
jgi:protein SCO1